VSEAYGLEVCTTNSMATLLKTLQIAADHDILLRSVSQSHRFLTPFYIKQKLLDYNNERV